MLLSFRATVRARSQPLPQPAPGQRVQASSPPPPPPLLFASFFSRQGGGIEFRIRDWIECPAPLLNILPREGEKVRHGVFWSERKTQSEGDCEPNREGQAEIGSAGTEAETEGRDLCSQQSNDGAGAAAI